MGSVLRILEDGATHLGVATDNVIESFRNNLYAGYKTGAGIDPDLMAQFFSMEKALAALGVRVWPMVEQEADDALAAAAKKAAQDERVEKVLICTPDKDLAQCVDNNRIVQLVRRENIERNAEGVWSKYGVTPSSIPDYLALVGDSADGFPGLPGWGVKSASSVLAYYHHLEDIPTNPDQWKVSVRNALQLSATLVEQWDDALLFRQLATLRTDANVFSNVDELSWEGPRSDFPDVCDELKATNLAGRAKGLAAIRRS